VLHNFTNCIWQCTGFFVMISALIAVSNEMLIFLERDGWRVAFEESTLEKIRRVVFLLEKYYFFHTRFFANFGFC